MDIRLWFVKTLSKHIPFSTSGDAVLSGDSPQYLVSCIINFYGRLKLTENILWCLSEQTLSKDYFEVILVEDRGGTPEGKKLAESFAKMLTIQYLGLPEQFGVIAFSRNYGLKHAGGKFILFLDDDTVILQRDFLEVLVDEFEKSGSDAIIPRGEASFCLYPSRYAYHDPYYPSSRCIAYRRKVLKELGGFISFMIGQEDVEFTFRFIATGRTYHRSRRLSYFHPPFIVDSLEKAKAVGISFAKLKNRYPLPLWLLLIANGLRFLPFAFIPPSPELKMYGRFSLGFLKGVMAWFRGERAEYR
ncbi:MAG: glycosyltransferase family 2 protein [Syntrophobacterales bacterium]|nr:glycosyltransferase family 2 protein [Syntrophobacterales bacterium]